MPYMQMTEEQFKVPVLKNVIYALRLVWQTDKRLLIGCCKRGCMRYFPAICRIFCS